MTRIKKFVFNVFLLTVTSLIMRSLALYFNVYLKTKLQSDGVGLFSLVSSVYSFAITFATSGISLATTRLCSEALGRNSKSEVGKAMRASVKYSLFFGISAFILLFFSSSFIGVNILKDKRTVSSLRLFSISLPLISLSSAFSGYFTAMRRVSKSALSQFAEQGTRIGLTVILFTFFAPSDLEKMCVFVVVGSVFADIVSFLFSLVLFIKDHKKYNKTTEKSERKMNKELLSIALPVAFSAYFRSGLLTLEHLLIPTGLKKSGLDPSAALASYGCVHVMAFPIIMFPYAFLSPFCSMLVPEIAGRNAAENEDGVRNLCEKAMKTVMVFGIGVSGIMLSSSFFLGKIIYSSEEASLYIKILAPLIPVMYLDTCVDSFLKGIGEQAYSMKVNIFDSLLSVFFAWFLVPRMGVYGYLIGVFVCEIINFALSFVRMYNRIKPKIPLLKGLFLPLSSAVFSASLTNLLNYFIRFPIGKLTLTLKILLYTVFYFIILILLSAIKFSDIKKIASSLLPEKNVKKEK